MVFITVDLRKERCIRKVQPLNRALQGANVWITGLRAEQSPNRQTMKLIEWDEAHQLFKFLLMNWSTEEVVAYLQKRSSLQYLHHKGFISIGCAPCNQSRKKKEDFRAGNKKVVGRSI